MRRLLLALALALAPVVALGQTCPDGYTCQNASATNHGTVDANRVFFTKSATGGTYGYTLGSGLKAWFDTLYVEVGDIGTTVLAPNGDGSGLSGVVLQEADPVAGAITGIVKGDGAGNLSAAAAGTDYQAALGSAGQGYWLVEEGVVGVQGLTKVGNWKMFYTSATGGIQALDIGSIGTYLKSNGTGGAPSWDTPAGTGTVDVSGTPTTGQIALWTDADTLEGASSIAGIDLNGVIGDAGTIAVWGSGSPYTLGNGSALTGVLKVTAGVPAAATPGTDYSTPSSSDTLTNKTLDATAASNVVTLALSKDQVILDPADADDHVWFKAPRAITLTNIHCITIGGTSITLTLQECDSAGANCASLEAITCDTDGAADDGSITDAAIDAGDWVKVLYGAPSGTVDALSYSVFYTEAQ